MFKNNFLKIIYGGLIFLSIALPSIFISNSVLAQADFGNTDIDKAVQKNFSGASCGISGQGLCKPDCDPFEEPISSISGSGQNTCLPSEPSCCVRTYCASSNLGVGVCQSSGSCNYGIVGTYTSDCTPPKICCVAQGTIPGANTSGSEVILPRDTGSDIFPGGSDDQNLGSAQSSPLVPCEGFDCSLCSFFTLIKNVINLLIELVFALAGGFIVWGAVEIMTAGANEGGLEKGKEKITTAIFGIVITLSGWLIIGTVLQVLTNSSSILPWNKIECSSAPLILAPVPTGNDYECTNKGGYCRDSSVIACEGTKTSGCNSPASKKNKKICCVPSKSSYTCEKVKNNKCMSGSLGARYKVGLGTCPSGQECFDVSSPLETVNPQL